MIKAAGGRNGKVSEDLFGNYDVEVFDLLALRAGDLLDIQNGGTLTLINGSEMLSVAAIDAQLHEVETARFRLASAVWDPASHPDAANAAWAQALLAEEVGDLPAAAKAWDSYAADWSDPTVAASAPYNICWAAPTYQKTGQAAKADAVLDAPMKGVGIASFVDCYRFRGDVLDLRGDWAGAQAGYAQAAKLGPSMPSGYYS